MNDLFVNIKVDREERPDLDQIYQARAPAADAARRRLAAHDVPHARRPVPFFAGTYFPKDRRYGMPAFREVLDGASRGTTASSATRSRAHGASACAQRFEQLDDRRRRRLRRARRRADRARASSGSPRRFDREHGGFGGAPKFPHATALELLLRTARRAATHRRRPRAPTWRRSSLHAHGRGRHLRPARRRLLPLQRRRALDDPALREDAVRQRARCCRSTPRRSRATGDAALWPRSPSETADWVDARDAVAATAASTPRSTRTPKARGRQVLRLDAARSSTRCCRRTRARLAKRVLGLTNADGTATAPNFEHRFWHLHLNGRATRRGRSARRRRRGARSRCSTPRARSCSRRARSASGPDATRRSSPRGTGS